jgi:hypothetical protein
VAKVFVTYDLEESGRIEPHETYRGAHELPVEAETVLKWEVGEFKRAWGRDVYGVRIVFRPTRNAFLRLIPLSSGKEISEEVVEIPANAQNVNVHVGQVPREYRNGLSSAA